MKVSSINNNYQNTNFNGTVSKSVYKYLNEARYDALNKPLSFFRDSNGKISTTMEYGEVKTLIEGIMTKLNNFMAKTHKNTYLFLSEMSDKRHIRITNPELETCIMGGFDWPKDSINNDEILSTGYTGAPRGRKNCLDMGTCRRMMLNVPRGERYEMCRSVHSEANAIISASRKEMLGATMYLVGKDYVTKELVG